MFGEAYIQIVHRSFIVMSNDLMRNQKMFRASFGDRFSHRN